MLSNGIFEAFDLIGFDDAKIITVDAPVKGVAKHPSTETGLAVAVIAVGTARVKAVGAIAKGTSVVSAAGGVQAAGADARHPFAFSLTDAGDGQFVEIFLTGRAEVSAGSGEQTPPVTPFASPHFAAFGDSQIGSVGGGLDAATVTTRNYSQLQLGWFAKLQDDLQARVTLLHSYGFGGADTAALAGQAASKAALAASRGVTQAFIVCGGNDAKPPRSRRRSPTIAPSSTPIRLRASES